MSNLYIGLISGTSVDAIDAALVRFDDERLELIGTHAHPWEAKLRQRLNALIESPAPAWHDARKSEDPKHEQSGAVERFDWSELGAVDAAQTGFRPPGYI